MDGNDFGLKQPIHLRGQVCYCKTIEKKTYNCGIKFLDLTDKHKKVIADYITTHDRRKASRPLPPGRERRKTPEDRKE